MGEILICKMVKQNDDRRRHIRPLRNIFGNLGKSGFRRLAAPVPLERVTERRMGMWRHQAQATCVRNLGGKGNAWESEEILASRGSCLFEGEGKRVKGGERDQASAS